MRISLLAGPNVRAEQPVQKREDALQSALR